MPRTLSFNSPFLLGFEGLEQLLENTVNSAGDSYPPYNIEHLSPVLTRISLAVAGFTDRDLEITQEDSQLVIRGKIQATQDDKTYLHRGIAARQFLRKFVLADRMDVDDAFLEHGLLNIDIVRPEPTGLVRRIKIRQ